MNTAYNYLIERCEYPWDIPEQSLDMFKTKCFQHIKAQENILGNGYSILWHRNENLQNIAKQCGISLPDYFSIILRNNSCCLATDSKNKGLSPIFGFTQKKYNQPMFSHYLF